MSKQAMNVIISGPVGCVIVITNVINFIRNYSKPTLVCSL